MTDRQLPLQLLRAARPPELAPNHPADLKNDPVARNIYQQVMSASHQAPTGPSPRRRRLLTRVAAAVVVLATVAGVAALCKQAPPTTARHRDGPPLTSTHHHRPGRSSI